MRYYILTILLDNGDTVERSSQRCKVIAPPHFNNPRTLWINPKVLLSSWCNKVASTDYFEGAICVVFESEDVDRILEVPDGNNEKAKMIKCIYHGLGD